MTRHRLLTFLAGAAVVTAAGVSVASAASAPARTTTARSATVRIASSRFGQILVDSRGRTLYEFSPDSRTKSACFGQCASFWPPLRANGKPTAGGRLRPSLIGALSRADGKPQVSYDGHPLYRFVMDKKPGDVNGEGLTAFGGRWFAISPTGKRVSPKPSTATRPKPTPAAGNGIPQGNGGDGDADNNGAPSDGDGNM
jgi:predicted lipoprotein with Yx(FWY)xxD motif